MNLSKIFDGSIAQFGSLANSLDSKKSINSFYESVFKKAVGTYQVIDRIETIKDENGNIVKRVPIYKTLEGEGGGQVPLSEFLNLQKSSESSAELASYLDQQGLTLQSLGNDRGERLNQQINTQAALQTIQNFYDMYISPVGDTDAKYRLGEVTGKAVAGTVNNQTDEYGRLRTRSLYNTKVDYYEWNGSNLTPAAEYYSVLWFPPFNPINIKSVSWKNTTSKVVDNETGLNVDSIGYLLDSNGNRITEKGNDGKIYYKKAGETTSSIVTMTMSDYIQQSKEKRQAELDEKNKELLANGEEVEETEVEDTRLHISTEEDRYYDTFDIENFLAARSSFTYRAPGFKAINDNINLLQWVLEGVSGITSTFLTEWDISLYLQEGLISDSEGTLPNTILLTHRMSEDNPNHYTDDRACSWGVLNCAVSKIYGHNKKTWAINAYPYSTWHTLYPDPTQYSGWLDKVTSIDGTQVYIPNFYRYGKEGLVSFLDGEDRNRSRGDNVQNRLMFQDFEGAALSGWTEWNFNNKIYKALYTTDDDGFSDVDLIFLQTSAGLYKKRDLIEAVQQTVYGISGDGDEYDGSDMVVAGSSGDGNNETTGYSFDDPVSGSGGNKYCPGSVFKGALTYLNMFNKRSSSKEAALSTANSVSQSSQGNTYGVFQDSLGLQKQSSSNRGLTSDEQSNFLLGIEKNLLDNSNGLGIAQYSPVLYGGPHSYYRSPKTYQAYYQENSLYLRNVPRIDKCPADFSHDSWAGITWPNLPNNQDDYYYKGNEKWCSNVSAVTNGERQAYEQSWSAGLSRLKNGIHHCSLSPVYMRVKVNSTVACKLVNRWHWDRYWWNWKKSDWRFEKPKYAPNGEVYNYYGDWWWEWRTESLYKTPSFFWISIWNHWWLDAYWRNYHRISWTYRRESERYSWRLTVKYLTMVQSAWHYEWQYTYFKRYVLHSEPNLDWKIVQTQHYYSYLANNSSGLKQLWDSVYRTLFGYNAPYEKLYQIGANEDYELFSEGGGTYSSWSIYDEKYRQQISFKMTGNEHRIMTNLVDWGGGIGSHNKVMFLTRDGAGNPDCLFRCELYHCYKPVFYWCEHHKTYSSRKTKYWWERHNGWKHYISVKLHSCDRFYAGLSKPAFTSYGSESNNEGFIGAATPPSNGQLTSAVLNNSIINTHFQHGSRLTVSNCSETRKSPFDLITRISGRAIPRYEPSRNSDAMVSSYNGIKGKGIIGDIPGLDFEANDSLEKFSDKCCSINFRNNGYGVYDTAFKYIQFPMYQISGWNRKSEISFNGNTYRPAGNGFALYREITPPSWWNAMILNMSLRNTFYKGDTNGPLKETFDIENYGIDVEGLSTSGAISAIANRSPKVTSSAGTFVIKASDIKNYTTVRKLVTKTVSGAPVLEYHDIVKTVILKNAWSAARYYFTTYDIAPRFLYNLLATQEGYTKFAKDFICGRTIGEGGKKGDYILSFDYIREIMEGNSSSDGLISPRTYYLADPNKEFIENPDGDVEINGVKCSYCDEMYGYNPWIKSAREWFCNSPSENNEKHQEIENELDKRLNIISSTLAKLTKFVALDIGSYSYNTMIESWMCLNEFIDLKNDEITEKFLLSYLNVLYEARKYFINKRCNKQNGTLWACRHLEKMIPQILASAVDSSANIKLESFGGTSSKELVAFYELNNSITKKMEVFKDKAINDSDNMLDIDRIKVVYVKVRYATYEDYLDCERKIQNGTLSRTDERIVPVEPIAYIKKTDGTYKSKENGDTLAEGEYWNELGWAVKKGKTKYAIKPTDGMYKLYSKEKHQDEDNISKRAQNPSGNYIIHNYDEAFWHIDWSHMAEKNQILYNYYDGFNATAMRDLSKEGTLDPIDILCSTKQTADYWIIPVQCKYPDASGYKSQLTLEMKKDGCLTLDELGSKDNPVALVGAAAYAMWPIIENQTDVIPNTGDLSQSLGSLI